MDGDMNRGDGYLNVITGVGAQRDPTTQTFYAPEPILTQQQLEAIFEGDGIGRRIVEMPAEEMCRGWFDVVGDEGEGVQDYLETLRMQQVFTDAAVWARLFGGSLVYLILEDGKDEQQPVDYKRIRKVVGAQVFDRWSVGFEPDRPSKDPILRLMGRPEFYNLTPLGGGFPIKVHESRVAYIPGRRLTASRRQTNGGWDASVLQGAWTALQRHGTGMGYSSNILRDFVQSVLAVKDLTAMIAAGREDVVERRIRLLDVSRSILNTIILDAEGEEYTKQSSSVAGLADILDRFAETLSAAVGIPITKLFGKAPGGLNSTGEHDMRNYYDMLASEQNRMLDPLAETIVKMVFSAKDGPTSGREPKEWSVRWRSLDQPTQKETAELRKQVADTDKIYIDAGVLSSDEVAQSRFGQGEWTMETQLVEGTDRNETASLNSEDAAALIAGPADPNAEEDNPDAGRGDAAPRTLYVSRRLVNVAEVTRWANEQGIKGLIDDLHVTITYSRAAVDWMKMGESWQGELKLPAGGPRLMERFDKGAIVLLFTSSELRWRHQSMLDAGASTDYTEYQPHLTLTYEDQDISAVEPYQGELVFGPEIFEEIE